jgi:hypothetical protein
MTAWSEEIAVELGRRALDSVGLGSAAMTVLKFGAIATFRVADPPRLLKVADPGFRSAEPVLERSLQLSAWLADEGFPVAGAAAEGSASPIAVDGAWAGLWNWQEHRDARPHPERTGQLLRRLHELLSECPVTLPELDHFDAARRHTVALTRKGHLDDAEVRFLTVRLERMEVDWKAFRSELGIGGIHGDFEVGNVLTTDRGPVLIDLDNAQVGPREWDLVKATPDSPNGWSVEEWAGFAAGYGYDLLSAPGNEVLREIRHLRSLVWMLGDPQYVERFTRGRRLLEAWMRNPEKRCFELDWR